MTKMAEVSVFCDDPSHADGRSRIKTFMRDANGEWDARSVDARNGTSRNLGILALVDDVPVTLEEAQAVTAAGGIVRYRHDLRCGLCDGRAKGREERLFAVLDTLADAGVHEVSLRGLAARLQ